MPDRRGQDDDGIHEAELRRREAALEDRSSRMQVMGAEIDKLRTEVDDIKATINRGKGAMLAVITIGGLLGWLLTWAKDLFQRGH